MVQHLTGKAKANDEKEYITDFFKNYEVLFSANGLSNKLRE
jgi:hypothetical protein